MSFALSIRSKLRELVKPEIAGKQFVRNRYWKDQQGSKPLKYRRFGYTDTLSHRGLLAHVDNDWKVQALPTYRPKDSWSTKRALFGQNDYIDILGDEKIHPVSIMYNVPTWLRGYVGNEYLMLLRKRRALKDTIWPVQRPTKWEQMRLRIKFLYSYLNRRQRTGMPPKKGTTHYKT